MTDLIVSNAGASRHKGNGEWDTLNWPQIRTFVYRLQNRIAKAERQGKPGKVKVLQRILATSFYAKCLAVKRVTDNTGGKTPGTDNVIWRTNRQKEKAVGLLKRRGYTPSPLRRIYIPKKSGGKRPLSIPTMKDRAIQCLWHMALVPVAEERADPNAYGFRPKRSAQDAMEACFNLLCRQRSSQWVLEFDIHKCFDSIDHTWLLNNIPMDKQILRKFLKAGIMEKGQFSDSTQGTPQGGIISPTLALMALSGIEKAVKVSDYQNKGKNIKAVLYADDGIITAASAHLLEDVARPRLEDFLKERGLELSLVKTKVTSIFKGFDFLGFHFKKYPKKGTKSDYCLMTMPAKDSMKSIKRSLKDVMKKGIAMPTDILIHQLNPKIMGWCQYYKNVVSSRAFSNLDSYIVNSLLRWSYKRHARKGKRWIKNHYFTGKGGSNWRFFTNIKNKEGKIEHLFLRQAMDVKIKRHIRIKMLSHPFNPEFKSYFEIRLKRKHRALKPTKLIGSAG